MSSPGHRHHSRYASLRHMLNAFGNNPYTLYTKPIDRDGQGEDTISSNQCNESGSGMGTDDLNTCACVVTI